MPRSPRATPKALDPWWSSPRSRPNGKKGGWAGIGHQVEREFFFFGKNL